MTALPIIETQFGDVSAYIPTNVISITDGQIYVDTELHCRGVRPGINIGLSVSRVGAVTQCKTMRAVAGVLRTDFAQFREVEGMLKFGGSGMDPGTRYKITRGARLVEMMNLPLFATFELSLQVLLIEGVIRGYFDDFVLIDAHRFKWFIAALWSLGYDTACSNVYTLCEITYDTEDNFIYEMYKLEAKFFVEAMRGCFKKSLYDRRE